MEMAREDKEDEGSSKNQLQIKLMECNLENASYHIPLHIIHPKKEWYPSKLQGPLIMMGVEENHTKQELAMEIG
uniref:Uncharacterized protein n=1 Tax=Solanum tuberosum TaxID=4113 RepID=M1DW24_SOLTU